MDIREVQNQQEGKNTLIRKPLYEVLSHYLDTLKINRDASLYSTALSYVDKISLRELQVQPAFIEEKMDQIPYFWTFQRTFLPSRSVGRLPNRKYQTII
jgi:hypothetical protein